LHEQDAMENTMIIY